MSDMWQVPEGLAESLLEPDPCADARNDAWANGVEAGKEYVGRILTDLIAELRSTCNLWQASGKNGVVHRVMPISEVIRLADRAEARLREVTGGE